MSLLQVVDVGFIAILFVAPWFFGGRDSLGRWIFIVMSCVTGVAWLAHQTLQFEHSKWTRSAANVLLLSALAIVTLQLVPLSPGWLEWLAPRNMALIPLWSATDDAPLRLGQWQTLSLTPADTKLALATLIAYALLFTTAVGRLQTLEDILGILKKIAIAALLLGSFGLLQYFFSNGRFFWFYEYPYTDTFTRVKGSFTCRNHLAHIMVLGTGPLLAWLVLRLRKSDKTSPQRRTSTSFESWGNLALQGGLALLVLTVLLTLSRGGAIAMLIAVVFAVSFYCRDRFLPSHYVFSMLGLGVLVLAALSLHGYEDVARRLDDFTASSLEDLDNRSSRRKIWAANLDAIQHGAWFGAGAGSHEQIYPAYLTESVNLRYTHAENSYLQIGSENGWLGLALLAFGLMLTGTWCWRALRHSPNSTHRILATAVTACLVASMAHAVVDFIWYIPACMSVTLILLACILRLSHLTRVATTSHESTPTACQTPWSQTQWITLTSAAGCAAIWAVSMSSGPGLASLNWNQYLLTTQEVKQQQYQLLSKFDQDPKDAAEAESLSPAMIYHLRKTLEKYPDFAPAHERLASRYLDQFEELMLSSDNVMSIDQIRDAAISSKFTSQQALRQWLRTAFGPKYRLLYQAHYHARRALQLSPLQGDAYLQLANLCFLEGRDDSAIDIYFNQALLVRPYDGGVLFEIGRQYLVAGRYEQAFKLLKQAYRHPGIHQLKTIQIAAGGLAAANFIEIFQPDWDTLSYVWKQYRYASNSENLAVLAHYAAHAAEVECAQVTSKRAANILLSLSQMQSYLNDIVGAVASLQQAYALAPHDYMVRRMLGRALLKAEQFPAAKNHLQWCLARKPGDQVLRKELLDAAKNRLPATTAHTDSPADHHLFHK